MSRIKIRINIAGSYKDKIFMDPSNIQVCYWIHEFIGHASFDALNVDKSLDVIVYDDTESEKEIGIITSINFKSYDDASTWIAEYLVDQGIFRQALILKDHPSEETVTVRAAPVILPKPATTVPSARLVTVPQGDPTREDWWKRFQTDIGCIKKIYPVKGQGLGWAESDFGKISFGQLNAIKVLSIPIHIIDTKYFAFYHQEILTFMVSGALKCVKQISPNQLKNYTCMTLTQVLNAETQPKR